jgi:hypothetical protein
VSVAETALVSCFVVSGTQRSSDLVEFTFCVIN